MILCVIVFVVNCVTIVTGRFLILGDFVGGFFGGFLFDLVWGICILGFAVFVSWFRGGLGRFLVWLDVRVVWGGVARLRRGI